MREKREPQTHEHTHAIESSKDNALVRERGKDWLRARRRADTRADTSTYTH